MGPNFLELFIYQLISLHNSHTYNKILFYPYFIHEEIEKLATIAQPDCGEF